jgi:hypothetical protein
VSAAVGLKAHHAGKGNFRPSPGDTEEVPVMLKYLPAPVMAGLVQGKPGHDSSGVIQSERKRL